MGYQKIKDLPIGAKVKFGRYSVSGETPQPITWLVVSKVFGASVTCLTEKIIDYRCFDAIEAGNPDRSGHAKLYGRPAYGPSNLRAWLNSNLTNWWSYNSSYDTSPTENTVTHGAPYADRPGFLSYFTEEERNSLPYSGVAYYNAWNDTGWTMLTDKVFLPAALELLGGEHSKEVTGYTSKQWEYFLNGASPLAYPTEQCVQYEETDGTVFPTVPSGTQNRAYWLREGNSTNYPYAPFLNYEGKVTHNMACNSTMGVRPAVNIFNDTWVTDTLDNEGCYVVSYDPAPSEPSFIKVPKGEVKSGESVSISWTESTDPLENSVTYKLLVYKNDSATATVLYNGAARSYEHFISSDLTSVRYSVIATNTNGTSSAEVMSERVTVNNNQAPVISGSDTNLGEKTSDFTRTYSVTDAENDVVTVVEAIDGTQIRSYNATLGVTNTISISGETFLKLNNGTHSLTITATDSEGAKSVRTYTFTKNVPYIYIETNAMPSSEMPTRLYMTVGRSIPEGATFTVKVTNNGNDASPTWEDATDSVVDNTVHNFSNTKKTAASWGVAIQVSVARNNAEGTCYVSSIGGNFE